MDKPIPEAVLDRLAHEVYQVHCDTPIRAFPNDSHWPKWRAVVQHVVNAITAAQQQGQAVMSSKDRRAMGWPAGDTAPPSAPVGVDAEYWDYREIRSGLHPNLWPQLDAMVAAMSAALAQQPAAVDGAWLSKARSLYDRCSLFPETKQDGMTALLELRNHVYSILATQHQEPTTCSGECR